MFLGRTRELAMLEEAHRARASALVPIYGRRRVGKSELILHFLQGKRAIYYLGKRAPAPMQRAELASEAAVALGQPLLEAAGERGYRDLFLAIEKERPKNEKLLLVLDELQWMVEASPELPSVLQELWDRHWRPAGTALVILCGSIIGFMERDILGSKSPLFGRRTAQILLRPFDHREAAAFHPGWSVTDVAKARFLCGGIPMYLRQLDRSLSIDQNIARRVLDELAPLNREPEFLLREELREVQHYQAVLHAIAQGSTRHGDIARASGVAERSLTYYLQLLMELGYVGRRHPLVVGKPSLRQVRYHLDDPLLRFWFRFVFPHQSYIRHMGPMKALRDRIEPELEAYWGACFERLCREALPGLYQREGVTASFEVGEYWDSDVQIDVVGLRDDGRVDLGECRWGRVHSARSLARELEERVPRYPNRRGATIARRFFVRKRPRGSLPDGHWHDLDDLYGA